MTLDFGPTVVQRELPRDVSASTVEELLSAVQRWLGTLWLEHRDDHPIRSLWHRTDWLATNELIALGMNVQAVEATENGRAFLRRILQHVRSAAPENRTGALWEMSAASMLAQPGQVVRFAKNSQSGFDLIVSPQHEPSMRISCKALNPSAFELEFRRFFSDLFDLVAAHVHPSYSPDLLVRLNGSWALGDLDAEAILSNLIVAISNAREPEGELCFDGATALFRPLRARRRLHGAEPNFSLTVASSYPKDEQRRFNSKLGDALSNLDKHVGGLHDGVANAVWIRVPSTVRMQDAMNAVQRALADGLPSVSGVYLYRAQLASQGNETAYIGHELRNVANPNARVALPNLHAQVPVGVVLDSEPPHCIYDGRVREEVQSTFAFTQGRLCFEEELAVPEDVGGLRYALRHSFGFTDAVSLVIMKDGVPVDRLDSAPPPPRWLVL